LSWLILGAILCLRRRTVTDHVAGRWSAGQGTLVDFHRVFSCRAWSCRLLCKVLAAMILEMIPADEPVVCPADDTTPQHKGKHVYGKGCHHDACRSTHSHMVWVWVTRWVCWRST